MKYKKVITNRILITAILLLVQAVWMAVAVLKLSNYSIWINIAFSVLSILMVLYIIGKDENSAYKIAWIILILCLPLFGGLLYLFFGNKTPSKKMRKRLNQMHKQMEKEFKSDETALDEMRALDERAAGISSYLKNVSDYAVYKDTDVKYYPVGELMFKDMLKAL